MISIKLKYSLTGYNSQYQGEQNVEKFLEWYLSQKKARQHKQEINSNLNEVKKFIESKFFNKTSHVFPGLESATDKDWTDFTISKLYWNKIRWVCL